VITCVVVFFVLYINLWVEVARKRGNERHLLHTTIVEACDKPLAEAAEMLAKVGLLYRHSYNQQPCVWKLPKGFWSWERADEKARALITLLNFAGAHSGRRGIDLAFLLSKRARRNPKVTLLIMSGIMRHASKDILDGLHDSLLSEA